MLGISYWVIQILMLVLAIISAFNWCNVRRYLRLNSFTCIDQYQNFIKMKTLATCIMKKAPIKRGSKMDFIYS